MVKPRDEGQRTAGTKKGEKKMKTLSPLLPSYTGQAKPSALLNFAASSIPSLLPAVPSLKDF